MKLRERYGARLPLSEPIISPASIFSSPELVTVVSQRAFSSFAMSTLTLTLDDDLLARAEAYAQRTGTDLSALVAEALRPIVEKTSVAAEPLPPELAALYGCISLPPGYDYKEELADAILDRKRA